MEHPADDFAGFGNLHQMKELLIGLQGLKRQVTGDSDSVDSMKGSDC